MAAHSLEDKGHIYRKATASQSPSFQHKMLPSKLTAVNCLDCARQERERGEQKIDSTASLLGSDMNGPKPEGEVCSWLFIGKAPRPSNSG